MTENINFYKSKWVPYPKGRINNTGTICYLNSLRAFLESFPSFNEAMYAYYEELPEFGMEYVDSVCSSLRSRTDERSRTVIENGGPFLRMFMNALRKDGITRYGHGQEDATEGIEYFLNCVNIKPITRLFAYKYTREFYCRNCKKKALTKIHKETMIRLDNIKKPLKQTDLTPEQLFVYNIRGSIDTYDKNYQCEKCKKRKGGYVKDILLSVSDIIIVQIKNFYSKTLVQFPLKFKLRRDTSSPNAFGNDASSPNAFGNEFFHYKLVSQIEHYGSMGGGHYKAICHRKKQDYIFDDSSISNSKLGPTINTYMLGYHIYDPGPEGDSDAVTDERSRSN